MINLGSFWVLGRVIGVVKFVKNLLFLYVGYLDYVIVHVKFFN